MLPDVQSYNKSTSSRQCGIGAGIDMQINGAE